MKNEFAQIFGEDVIENYDKDSTGWKILISEILNQDKSFNLTYSSETAEQLTLEKFFATLESAYGIGFDEIQKLSKPEYYNGYYIQERTLEDKSKEYYVTKRYTTEKQPGTLFMSMNDAKAYIDSLDLEIVDNAYKSLHTIKETDSIEMSLKSSDGGVGSIITVLDYKVPSLDFLIFLRKCVNFYLKMLLKLKCLILKIL